jgi:hypothetical protein
MYYRDYPLYTVAVDYRQYRDADGVSRYTYSARIRRFRYSLNVWCHVGAAATARCDHGPRALHMVSPPAVAP